MDLGLDLRFHWTNPLNAIRARRHLLARLWDTTDSKRKRWVDQQAVIHGGREFRLARELPEQFSFLVVGDTGEGDSSQQVLVDGLVEQGAGAAFLLIAGDVVYPAGRSHHYRNRFYVPYRNFPADVYAIPGNHDWYDELAGFMLHFCDQPRSFRGDPIIGPDKLAELRRVRRNRVYQPNMYFYADSPSLRIVCLDTGIRARIDDEQLEWLGRVSRDPRPKLLVLGTPIYADGRYRERLGSVDRIVQQHGYVLVVSGDVHNYQRYRIPLEPEPDCAGRAVFHVVAGGGGAYLSRTHRIPLAARMRLPVRLAREPEDFDCFPSREQSRLRYSRLRHWLPDWLADDDRPPYYKSFLRIDATPERLRVRVLTFDDFGPGRVAPHGEWEIALR